MLTFTLDLIALKDYRRDSRKILKTRNLTDYQRNSLNTENFFCREREREREREKRERERRERETKNCNLRSLSLPLDLYTK